MSKKQKATEALHYIDQTISKMVGASVGEVRNLDKCLLFLSEVIQSIELPPEPLKEANSSSESQAVS